MGLHSDLLKSQILEIRRDCMSSCAQQSDSRNSLRSFRIAVTGGTGFIGTWIAEMIATLNDEYDLNIVLDLYARNIDSWKVKYPHLSNRGDIYVVAQDVRSTFQFHSLTNFVIHAAGVPDNREHASDPLRVQQTTVEGISNALNAASQLDGLKRFLNISSCCVSGTPPGIGPISEDDFFPMPAGRLDQVYAESKRSAESLATIYRSQYRMPISTVRPFTFAGPYQALDSPWAINNFLNDALSGRDIRIYGNGSASRSYLYGSDAAWGMLLALIKGVDGGVYNIGSSNAVTHFELANLIARKVSPNMKIILNTAPTRLIRQDVLYPNMENTEKNLGLIETCSLERLIDRIFQWHHS